MKWFANQRKNKQTRARYTDTNYDTSQY
jgi:hypothetical protein